jgi:nicotinamidase-related amidase
MELPKELEEIYDEHEFGQEVGWGDSPAILAVDLEKGFTDPDVSSLTEVDASEVIGNISRIVDVAHELNVPVFFIKVVYRQPNAADAGIYLQRHPSLEVLTPDSEATEIDDRLDVQDTDFVVEKRAPSAFHDTGLNSMLHDMGIDTVIVTGISTSGCIRASVIDACQHNYKTIVPKEAVGDRHSIPHQANLFDMDMKYADVKSIEDVIKDLNSVLEEKG